MQRRRPGKFHALKTSHLKHPRQYKVVCSGCGKEIVTPVPPPNGKELLCMECFNKEDR